MTKTSKRWMTGLTLFSLTSLVTLMPLGTASADDGLYAPPRNSDGCHATYVAHALLLMFMPFSGARKIMRADTLIQEAYGKKTSDGRMLKRAQRKIGRKCKAADDALIGKTIARLDHEYKFCPKNKAVFTPKQIYQATVERLQSKNLCN